MLGNKVSNIQKSKEHSEIQDSFEKEKQTRELAHKTKKQEEKLNFEKEKQTRELAYKTKKQTQELAHKTKKQEEKLKFEEEKQTRELAHKTKKQELEHEQELNALTSFTKPTTYEDAHTLFQALKVLHRTMTRESHLSFFHALHVFYLTSSDSLVKQYIDEVKPELIKYFRIHPKKLTGRSIGCIIFSPKKRAKRETTTKYSN